MIDLRNPGRRGRALAAVLGGAAAVAMCVVGAAAAHDDAASPVVVSSGSMSTGETATVEYSETEATSVASPTVKATPFGGAGS
jgi:hypothetical protein